MDRRGSLGRGAIPTADAAFEVRNGSEGNLCRKLWSIAICQSQDNRSFKCLRQRLCG